MQEFFFFFVNDKALEVANYACQSMVLPVWSVIKNDWSVKSPFVGFLFVLDKSFVAPVLVDIC